MHSVLYIKTTHPTRTDANIFFMDWFLSVNIIYDTTKFPEPKQRQSEFFRLSVHVFINACIVLHLLQLVIKSNQPKIVCFYTSN